MPYYIITHKDFVRPESNEYKSILAGAYKNKAVCDYRDDSQYNISNRNETFCELTAINWIWKNINDDNYVGIVHYRRYFSISLTGKPLNEKVTKSILKKYDIILPLKAYLNVSVKQQLFKIYSLREEMLVRNAIKKHSPEYLNTYESVLDGNEVYYCNMMVSNRRMFNEYCSWLFPILFEIEKNIDMSGFDNYQRRFFGFLSERLLTVWVKYNNYRIKEIGMYEVESNDSKIKKVFNSLRRVVSYRFSPINSVLIRKMERKIFS